YVVDVDRVRTVSRKGDVQKWVGSFGVAALGDLAPAGVEQPQRGVEAAVEPLGLNLEEQPIAFLSVDAEAIGIRGGGLSIHDRAELDRIGLRRVVVGLGLALFDAIVDDEHARVADAVATKHANVVMTEGGSGRARNAEHFVLDLERPQPGMIEPEARRPLEV